jgi:hypothetical protein
MGMSGPFLPRKVGGWRWKEIEDHLPKIIQEAPIDIRDLTIENSALDIGMLAIALIAEPAWTANSKLALYGHS